MLTENNMANEIKADTTAEKMVTVAESQLKALTDRLDKLEKEQTKPFRPTRVNENTATLRVHDGKLVIGSGNVYQKFNEMTQSFEDYWDIVLKDGDKRQKVSVNYPRFMSDALKVNVKIVSKKEEKREEVTMINLVDPKTDSPYRDRQIENIVTYVDYVSTVEVLEGEFKGETITLDNKFLNN